LRTVGIIAKKAIKAHAIDVQITWVSNYRCSNWIPVIGHPPDRAPITWQKGARRTNHHREFRYRYDNNNNNNDDDDDDDNDNDNDNDIGNGNDNNNDNDNDNDNDNNKIRFI